MHEAEPYATRKKPAGSELPAGLDDGYELN
jgi:hypothetical protein